MLTDAEIINHESIHALKMLNGEEKTGNPTQIIYYEDDKGRQQKERVYNYEYIAVFESTSSKKYRNYNYPSENDLRKEQKRKKRINYYEQFRNLNLIK